MSLPRLITCLMVGSDSASLLEMHLNATSLLVSAWVVVEAEVSLAGRKRSVNHAMISRLAVQYGVDRVQHVIVPAAEMHIANQSLLSHRLAFENEALQRSRCASAVRTLQAQPMDQVLILDPDELPSPAQLEALRHVNANDDHTLWSLPMLRFHYDLACPSGGWRVGRAASWALVRRLAEQHPDRWAYYVRATAARPAGFSRLLRDGSLPSASPGLHMTYAVTDENITQKLLSFAHTEFASGHVASRVGVAARVAAGCDPLMRANKGSPRLACHARWNVSHNGAAWRAYSQPWMSSIVHQFLPHTIKREQSRERLALHGAEQTAVCAGLFGGGPTGARLQEWLVEPTADATRLRQWLHERRPKAHGRHPAPFLTRVASYISSRFGRREPLSPL